MLVKLTDENKSYTGKLWLYHHITINDAINQATETTELQSFLLWFATPGTRI